MKKWFLLMCCPLLAPAVFAQAIPPEEEDEDSFLIRHVIEAQARSRANALRTPVSQIKLSEQSQALVDKIMRDVAVAQDTVKTLPCPQEVSAGESQEDRLEAIGSIVDAFTEPMDQYNALYARDVQAARVAGARMAQTLFVCEGGTRFTMQDFLKEHQPEMLQVVILEELAQEFAEFAKHLSQDLKSFQQ